MDEERVQQLIAAGIREVIENPQRYGLTWRRLPATVAETSTTSSVTVVIDGDTLAVQATSLVGPLNADARVMVDAVPPSGLYVVGQTSTPAGYRFSERVILTADGTFTLTDDPGIRAAAVFGVGGGGGSGGCAATAAGQSAASGGGGGGGYAYRFYPVDELNSSTAVVVGQGGSLGAAGNNNGGTGTDSTFAAIPSTLTMKGGTGGTGSPASASLQLRVGGVGVLPTGGDINIQGGDGGSGISLAATYLSLGFGGASLLGGSTRITNSVNGGAGTAGRLYGGGAGGSFLTASQSAVAGNTGANGIVIVDVYV